LEKSNTLSTKTETGSSAAGRVRLLVGVAVSVASVVLVLRGIDWDAFWTALQGAEYWWLVPSMTSLFVAVGVKVLKWQMLLAPAGKTSKTNVFYSISIGYLVSDVLPGRLGEVARVYTEARLDRLSPVAVLASVAADRILDIVAVALLLAVALPSADLPPWVIESGLLMGAGAVALLAVCILLAYPVGRKLFLQLLAASPRFPGKALIEKWAEELCIGMQGLRGIGAQLRIGLATVAVWLLTVLMFYFGLLAFHINAPIWAAVLALALTNLGMVVPSSPGYIGVFHYLVVLALGAFGVQREMALGYAIVIHLLGFVPVGLVGALSLWRCGLTLMDWRGTAGAGADAGPVMSDE
jgi:glycosyltransferase 2 family protein